MISWAAQMSRAKPLRVSQGRAGPCERWRCVGVDPSQPMLALAARRIAAQGLGDTVELRLGTVESLPEDAGFDAAVLLGVLHQGPASRRGPRRVRRSARDRSRASSPHGRQRCRTILARKDQTAVCAFRIASARRSWAWFL
ncbi:class I SAM-dependent methyltransferase [Bosea sp. LC85]|uniref:methyltransferase domain-containing protein n=1 Tax=Bosea sp. LC85 TaxID=1502851 RepID=UPI0009E01760